jgi:hypothetical protein
MSTFHAIVYLMMLHSTLQAAINNTEKEKEFNEETDSNISKFNNAANIFAAPGTGNYHKVSTFYIDRTEIKCEYDNLLIFWHQPDKDGNRLKLSS